MSSFKVDFSSLKRLAEKFTSNPIKEAFRSVAKEKSVAALIGQAIADNFNQEGPGWAPLKAQTIRRSVSRTLRKEMGALTDDEILKHEKKAREQGSQEDPYRRILQKTGLLKKTASQVGFTGTSKPPKAKKGKPPKVSVTGSNIYKVENFNIVWGTNLPYAKAHNEGIGVPKREFLVLRDQWKKQLDQYVLSRVKTYLKNALKGAHG